LFLRPWFSLWYDAQAMQEHGIGFYFIISP
jgi:hypothetical protein